MTKSLSTARLNAIVRTFYLRVESSTNFFDTLPHNKRSWHAPYRTVQYTVHNHPPICDIYITTSFLTIHSPLTLTVVQDISPSGLRVSSCELRPGTHLPSTCCASTNSRTHPSSTRPFQVILTLFKSFTLISDQLLELSCKYCADNFLLTRENYREVVGSRDHGGFPELWIDGPVFQILPVSGLHQQNSFSLHKFGGFNWCPLLEGLETSGDPCLPKSVTSQHQGRLFQRCVN